MVRKHLPGLSSAQTPHKFTQCLHRHYVATYVVYYFMAMESLPDRARDNLVELAPPLYSRITNRCIVLSGFKAIA